MSIFDYFFYDPSREEGKASQAYKEAEAGYSDIQAPDYQPINYTSPEYVGDVTAQQANPYTMGSTAMEGISTDPALRGSQLSQIAALEKLRDQGGMTLTDEANLQKIKNAEMGKELSQRQAIMEQARQRGTGGSGMELMAMLQANQAGTNRQSQRDLEIAGMAQDRALQAGGQAAGLAGQVRGQDFSQEAQIAAAKDAASKFNASMLSGTDQFNVGNQLRAAQANQAMRQNVGNIGAENYNKSQTMNKFTMPGQRFTDQMARANALANIKTKQGDRYQTAANQGVATQGQLWGSGIGALTSLMGNNMQNAGSSAMGATSSKGGSGAPNFGVTPDDGGWQTEEEDPQLSGFWK
jgi:hypothetical protein